MSQLGRISGPLLEANLNRLGVDLTFRNYGADDDLLYLDVTNNRLGVNKQSANRRVEIDATTHTTNLISTTSADIATITATTNIFSTDISSTIIVSPNQINPLVTFDNMRAGDLDFKDNIISNYAVNGGIELKCVKINKNNPEDSQASVSGPYPWSGVEYDKLSRPVKLRLHKTGTRDVEYGTKDSQIMTLSLEEVTDPVLKELTNKKYILVTYNSPGVTGKQYCRVEGEMDQEWEDNFFNFGKNSNIIDPFPKLD